MKKKSRKRPTHRAVKKTGPKTTTTGELTREEFEKVLRKVSRPLGSTPKHQSGKGTS